MTFQNADNGWTLNTVETVSSERLVSTRTPTFVNSTDKWKLNELPVSDRKEAIRRGGYALVVADLDNDGLKDMIVGHHGPVQILKNTGSDFVDVTKEYGILEEGSVKSAAGTISITMVIKTSSSYVSSNKVKINWVTSLLTKISVQKERLSSSVI